VFNGLSVGMTKAQDPTLADGAQAIYLIAVLNRRTTPVDGVQLALQLPAGATVVNSTGGCQAIPCALGTMQPLELRPVFVTVQAPSPTVYPFEVTAQLSATSTGTDDNLTSTVSAAKAGSTSGSGGGCSVGGVPAAMVLVLVVAAALRSRRKVRGA
jgi:MYXO-CTERM domain-containing protein